MIVWIPFYCNAYTKVRFVFFITRRTIRLRWEPTNREKTIVMPLTFKWNYKVKLISRLRFILSNTSLVSIVNTIQIWLYIKATEKCTRYCLHRFLFFQSRLINVVLTIKYITQIEQRKTFKIIRPINPKFWKLTALRIKYSTVVFFKSTKRCSFIYVY